MSETNLSPRTEASETKGAEPEAIGRKRILLVEGDGFTRLVLLLRLRLAGFAVDFTSNGVLGRDKLRNRHPDVLLVELKLFGLSGLELIKAARTDPTFGDRPIYVYTDVDRMNRNTRKEVGSLATKIFDKATMTREDLVQILVATFHVPEASEEPSSISTVTQAPEPALSEIVPPGALQEIIAGVRSKSEVLARTDGDRAASAELLSRVCSLASCAEAAGQRNLALHAKALERFLYQLCSANQACTEGALSIVTRAVDVMTRISFEPSRPPQNPSRFSAVFVDESPYSNRAMEEALLNSGFDPVCFEDPSPAREYLASYWTELIIVNVALPEAHCLALADIRQLPLHAETPVFFGPESIVATPRSEDLPTSAPRLDKEPLLLAEMVVRALNEVQDAGNLPKTDGPQSASPLPSRQLPANIRNGAVVGEDEFELFSRKPRKETLAPESAAEQTLPAEQNYDTQSWLAQELVQDNSSSEDNAQCETMPGETVETPGCLFTASNIQVEPGATDADCEAELLARMPVNPVDASQVPDQLIEALPQSELLVEAPLPPQQEITIVEGTPGTAFLATAANESDQIASLRNSSSEYDQIQADVLALQNNHEFMKNEMQSARVESAQRSVGFERGEAQTEQRDMETARQQAEACRTKLTQELGGLGEKDEELANKPAGEEKTNEASDNGSKRLKVQPAMPEALVAAPASDREQQFRQGVAILAQTTAELARERGERQRSQKLAAELNGQLKALHEDFSRTLQVQGDHLSRIDSLEQQQRQTSQALDRCTSEVEQQQAERRLAEAQLQKTKEVNAQLRKDLSFFEERNKQFEASRLELQTRLETSLAAARENEARLEQQNAERQQIRSSLESARRELQDQSQGRERLEQELQLAREALQDREARLQKQTAECQVLQAAMDSLQRSFRDGSQRDLELSKLQSALELERVERKRQETQLARTRHSALDAAHAARTLRNSLRRQIREPVDNLVQSARSLLEQEMGDAQKNLAEAVLQDGLLVQTRLREPELAHSDSAEVPATKNKAST